MQAVELIHSRTPLRPSIAVVLGSGLGAFADSLGEALRMPYADIPGLPASTAIGHKGELVVGKLKDSGTPVAVMSGRFHLYEGYTAREVTAGVRLFHALGIRSLVLTNAAGGINLDYGRGALVAISDHINLQGDNPLKGPNDDTLGPRFPDMTEAYSPRLRSLAKQAAEKLGIPLHEGVYAGLLGPSYETPAEIRFLKAIGADLVGMSTVAETIAANHMGMEVLGISCVTNLAAGLSGEKLNHEEVLEVGRRVSGTFLKLLSAVLPQIGSHSL
ncbi:MAG TPA: purine-nucleoside phosphorylase [Bryobacteraceae bacterium]|jgi:purine-nucleoside phosphorylase|nr:purine-nucleoside phosphorylase [Bryobacteraceae bacterium]